MRKLIVFSIILFTSGCTSYVKKSALTGGELGYSDTQLGEGHFTVKYEGSKLMGAELTKKYWEKRASELCSGGYTVINFSKTNKMTTNYGGSPGYYTNHDHPVYEGEIKCI